MPGWRLGPVRCTGDRARPEQKLPPFTRGRARQSARMSRSCVPRPASPVSGGSGQMLTEASPCSRRSTVGSPKGSTRRSSKTPKYYSTNWRDAVHLLLGEIVVKTRRWRLRSLYERASGYNYDAVKIFAKKRQRDAGAVPRARSATWAADWRALLLGGLPPARLSPPQGRCCAVEGKFAADQGEAHRCRSMLFTPA